MLSDRRDDALTSEKFDRVENVTLEDLRVSDVIENEELAHKLLQVLRIDPSIQPNMGAGVGSGCL